jgi:hypothetical protein
MAGLESEIVDAIDDEYTSAQALTGDAEDRLPVPVNWQPILDSADSVERCRIALSLWTPQFLDKLPKFSILLPERLADVRVLRIRTGGEAPAEHIVLAYAAGHNTDGELILWIGHDPANFADAAPKYFETIPQTARDFLQQTHAGFTSEDMESYGLMPPRDMQTLAESVGAPPDEQGWQVGYGGIQINSTRLLWLTRDSGELLYCTSPDLPAGTMALVYEGDIDDPPPPFWTALDEILVARWDE